MLSVVDEKELPKKTGFTRMGKYSGGYREGRKRRILEEEGSGQGQKRGVLAGEICGNARLIRDSMSKRMSRKRQKEFTSYLVPLMT